MIAITRIHGTTWPYSAFRRSMWRYSVRIRSRMKLVTSTRMNPRTTRRRASAQAAVGQVHEARDQGHLQRVLQREGLPESFQVVPHVVHVSSRPPPGNGGGRVADLAAILGDVVDPQDR